MLDTDGNFDSWERRGLKRNEGSELMNVSGKRYKY